MKIAFEMSEDSISSRLKSIQNRVSETCQRIGRDSNAVKVIAVSKTKPNEAILEALSAGQIDFGENKMQELQTKMGEIHSPEVQWHMIGTLQTNKIRHIAHRVNWIHSVGKAKYLNEIEKRAAIHNRIINVLIQVNISGEDQKSGCEISELEHILNHARQFEHIRIKGLMGMATFTDDLEQIRMEFRTLKKASDQHQHLNEGNVDLKELSMGMSGDFEVAIEEGSTMIRVGSSIFGARNYA
ncbi:MAG: YggS family pyridoxal phosphate-dependent enzyme [Balneolales bacterium]|nr:YggS family pyridoxal phosphate-dependent enzyme [Balneolales bacterium]